MPRRQRGQGRRDKSPPVLCIVCSMLLTDSSFLDLIAASLVPAGCLLCAMLDADSAGNYSIPASLCLQVFQVYAMLDADSVVFDLIATSLLAAGFTNLCKNSFIALPISVPHTPSTSFYRNHHAQALHKDQHHALHPFHLDQ